MNRRELPTLRSTHRATLFAVCVLTTIVSARADVFDRPATAAALAAGPLAGPAKQIADAQVIRGRFLFKRYLADIPKPLESSGDYTLVKGLGIDWHTREPFDSEAIVTARGVVQIDDGNASPRVGGDAPAQQAAIRLLSALLTLDVETLATSFELFGGADGARWSLGLRPRAQDVQTFVRDATISGAAQVETVELHDANGDRTSIEFHDVAYDASPPSAAERARFEQ